ncbi:MAG: 30S ribosomal protein S18 [Patescibacteria group bacterium]|nr:30S ribosomal protein S18 [Patescibacteria group bacterium]
MASKKKKVIKKQKIEVPSKCAFCEAKKEPDYKDYKFLEKFLSDRAKILGKERTGLCSKHARKLPREIKRARHLALLPFSASV